MANFLNGILEMLENVLLNFLLKNVWPKEFCLHLLGKVKVFNLIIHR